MWDATSTRREKRKADQDRREAQEEELLNTRRDYMLRVLRYVMDRPESDLEDHVHNFLKNICMPLPFFIPEMRLCHGYLAHKESNLLKKLSSRSQPRT